MRRIKRLRSDWMLVELEPVKQVTSGGIIKPDTSPEIRRLGRVKQAGPGRIYSDDVEKPMPNDIVGKRVLFMLVLSKQGEELRSRLQLDADHELIRLGDVLLEVDDDWEGELG